MQSDKQYSGNESQPSLPRRKLELFFFETVGTRTHLRFTRLGVIVSVLLIVVPLIIIFVLFFFINSRTSGLPLNTNVSVRTPTPSLTNSPILQPPPPAPRPPKLKQQLRMKILNPIATKSPINNNNGSEPARSRMTVQSSNSPFQDK